jgi:hypothetical protein
MTLRNVDDAILQDLYLFIYIYRYWYFGKKVFKFPGIPRGSVRTLPCFPLTYLHIDIYK